MKFAVFSHIPVIQRCLHPASVSLELFWLPDVARLGCARQTDFDDHWPSNAFRIAIISQGSHSTNPKDMFFIIFVWLVSSRPVSSLSHPVVTGPLLPGCCLSCKKSWIIPPGFLWKTHPRWAPLGVPWGPLVPWVGCWLWAPWTSSSVMETPRRRGTTSVVSPWATHLGCWRISGCEIWEDSPWFPWYFHKHKILHRLVS